MYHNPYKISLHNRVSRRYLVELLVFWTYDTSNINFRINHKFTKYLKEDCALKSIHEKRKAIMSLTHSCSETSLTHVFRTCATFENNLRINHNFPKYLMENCALSSE